MTTVKRIGYALLATVTLALGGMEMLAQQTGGAPVPGAGRNMQGQGHQGMDMQTMANQCAQVRRQRQQNPSAPMSADMQKNDGPVRPDGQDDGRASKRPGHGWPDKVILAASARVCRSALGAAHPSEALFAGPSFVRRS